MPTLTTLRNHIETSVDALSREYQRTQGLFLTEDDLKCALYHKLYTINTFSSPETTLDEHISSIRIHSEVSWFDENGRLTIKPDITILEPSHLSILRGLNGRRRLPSKQFQTDGGAILLELKFVRGKSGVTHKTLQSIKKDLQKARTLLDRHSAMTDHNANGIFCFVMICSDIGGLNFIKNIFFFIAGQVLYVYLRVPG